MQVFRQELHAFPLRALLDQATEEIGAPTLERFLERYGISGEDLADSTIWVSVAFVDSLLSDIVGQLNGDDTFLERAAERGIAPHYMGPLYPLATGFGSPLFFYRQLPRNNGRFDKLGAWSVERAAPGNVELRWTRHPDAPFAAFLCRFRDRQLAMVPTLFSLPAAQVTHAACVQQGAPACVFDVRWQEEPRRWEPVFGALGGAGAAWGFAAASGLTSGATLGLTSLLVAGGWALGKARVLRQALASRVRDLATHHQALEHLTKQHEERYAELLEAKQAVEERVEERTRELRVTTQQLSQTLQQVQELDRARTNFFSNVSHELRTPLTLLLGTLGELAEGREPAGGLPRALEVMQQNGAHLLTLINQLLDLSKMDAGQLQLERVPMDLTDLARRIESRFATVCAQRGVQFATEVSEVERLAVDPTWTESALTNLVANAVRFAASKIVLRVRRTASAVELEVEDDGPGIAPEDLPRVFDRFVQGSHTGTRQGSTGLGLAIARETARLHGGDVSVRSQPGRITAFTLSLPRSLATSEEANAERAVRSSPGPIPSPVPAEQRGRSEWPGPDPSAPLVVLVEDNAEVRELVGGVLASAYRVRAARNGADGLALISESHPEAVVSDVLMPDMDGYALCRELRKRPETRALPVLLLTARGGIERVVEGFEAGAEDYVTKPFHPRELLARVGVHVRLRRMVSELAHSERLVALGVLAASLAHQLRSPLTAISLGLPALRQRLGGALDARNEELLNIIIESGERIEALIVDMLNLSRVDRDTTTRFQPAEGVRASIRLMQARTRSAVQIDAEIAETGELEGRPGDVSHVFLNLLDNAVRAAEPAGRVCVRTFERDGHFVFEVGDSGAGVPQGKEDTIFALFYTTRSVGEGTGLGLAIARQVVLQHGGSISVGCSELGGALFKVKLPLAPPLAQSAVS